MPLARHTTVRLTLALLLLCGLAATVAHAQQGGFKIKEINSSAPIKNFRLPTFTAEGWRDMMLKAGEARVISAQRIEVRDLHLTLYTDDIVNLPETVVTSPQAVALPDARHVEGADTVHVKRHDFELTGRDWSYDHPTRTIVIGADAHVVLQTEISNLLK